MVKYVKASVGNNEYGFMPGYHEWILYVNNKPVYVIGDFGESMPDICTKKNLKPLADDIAYMFKSDVSDFIQFGDNSGNILNEEACSDINFDKDINKIRSAILDGLYLHYGEDE
jgi:hypothetical protein